MLLESLSHHLETERPRGVVSVYLFGSAAEGRAHRDSDVDVGVLLDRGTFGTRHERARERERLGSELIHACGANEVDVIVLNDVPPLLGRHVVTKGVRVYCSDSEADHEFVRDVQLRAADLAPFLERMARIKLEALRR
ncbi:MAG: nucleotidyltransferase domain-containing protein [Gemmatimonadetes bacterium]|nr:nucleotidyltransferase domain-containing protein [Gemmatimonadota bacterium]